MKKIIAKSSGVTLIDHSKLVSKFAVEIAKQTMLEENEDLVEAIRLGSLLHDIGKCQTSFQKKLKNVIDDEVNIETKLPYRHNEVGWAFLNRYLSLNKRTILDMVLDVIYWHHGISNTMGSYKDTDVKISDTDIKTMTEFATSLLGDVIKEKPYKPKSAPSYYVSDVDDANEVNSLRTFVRTCVISADRLVSSITKNDMSDDEITEMVTNLKRRDNTVIIDSHTYADNERFSLQKSILDDVDRTTVIKAPAGFGKTLLGLMWSFRSNNKLIWVCPRNIVATSVYESIVGELENFDDNDVSVELFLASEVVKSNTTLNEAFSSDIIVTNIDNYLAPSVDNRSANRLHSIINYDVIFDEYHELISDTPLNACFVNLMSVRHQLSNSDTLLLSATPTNVHTLWDGIDNKTKLLPNENEHYPAPHGKSYNINILNEFPSNPSKNNNLFIFNSIMNAQNNKVNLSSDVLYHSSFMDDDKKIILNKIFDNYGKKTNRSLGKFNMVGTHIVQASLDISFLNLFESTLSPESTLQRIGRCDRWGDYQFKPSINLVNLNNRSENKVKEVLYSVNLSNMWFEFISETDKKELTLGELYILYNEFNRVNSKVLREFLIDKHTRSLDSLSNIHPVKFFTSNRGKSDVKTAGGNKLRSSNLDTFVICKNYNSDTYCDPFNVSIYRNHGEDFNEVGNIQNRLLKTMKAIRNMNDTRFDYNEIINDKKINLDKIRKLGKKSNTPYIRFDKVYHPDYGLISEDNLINLLNN